MLYEQYQSRKSQVEVEIIQPYTYTYDLLGQPAVVVCERQLWHGTDYRSAQRIYKREFNRSFAGKNGELHPYNDLYGAWLVSL